MASREEELIEQLEQKLDELDKAANVNFDIRETEEWKAGMKEARNMYHQLLAIDDTYKYMGQYISEIEYPLTAREIKEFEEFLSAREKGTKEYPTPALLQ